MAKPSLTFLLPLAAFALLVVIAATALIGTLNGTRKTDQLPSVLIGKSAPPLPATALTREAGKSLASFAGKPVIVNFMASWCAPCRAELPALQLLSDEDVAIIAVAYKDKNEDTADFLAQYGNPYDAVWMDYDGTTGIGWGIYGVPETFVIDGHGKVVLRHAGPVFREVLEEVLRPALASLDTQ